MSQNTKLKAKREAKQRRRFKERKMAAWCAAAPKYRGPMPFAAIALITALIVAFCASNALALDKPAVSPEPSCCGCDSCYCDNECLCPVVLNANGKRVVMEATWKHPVAAMVKRTAAAPFRFIFSEPKRVFEPAEVADRVPAEVLRNYRPLVVK